MISLASNHQPSGPGRALLSVPTTTAYFLMGFGREPQEVPATTTVSFAKIPLDSERLLFHADSAPGAKPRVSSNDDTVGRYRHMAPAVVRCDGCLDLEILRGERRVCGSGTRPGKSKRLSEPATLGSGKRGSIITEPMCNGHESS